MSKRKADETNCEGHADQTGTRPLADYRWTKVEIPWDVRVDEKEFWQQKKPLAITILERNGPWKIGANGKPYYSADSDTESVGTFSFSDGSIRTVWNWWLSTLLERQLLCGCVTALEVKQTVFAVAELRRTIYQSSLLDIIWSYYDPSLIPFRFVEFANARSICRSSNWYDEITAWDRATQVFPNELASCEWGYWFETFYRLEPAIVTRDSQFKRCKTSK